ncbi:MAG: SulP family inorganic anion transporter, partial [Truepera sp.]|nr:SulP family inorganic anion transporter [Truepera sp.]
MNYDFNALRRDILGGVTAMVVALPLSLAYGVMSGMGAAAGLYGAIAVGFFAALFGGTATQISGPTAPMAIVMAVIVTSYTNSLSEALTVV